MTGAEIDELLDTGSKLQVATNGPDGHPHLTTLYYALDGGRVVFRSFTKSQRIVNLRRDPRLTVLVEEGEGYGDLRGVMIAGTATLSDDPGRVVEVYAKVLARARGTEPDLDEARAMFARHASKNTAVEVTPERVVSWDHRKLDGAY